MSYAGHIFIPGNQRMPHQVHQHSCPVCRKAMREAADRHRLNPAVEYYGPKTAFHREGNEVCQKGWDHVFPCVNHLMDARARLGTDWILDTWLSMEETRRLRREAPVASVDERERVEAETNADLAETMEEPQR